MSGTTVLMYFLVGLISMEVGRVDRRINVATASAVIAAPMAVLTVIGVIAALYAMFSILMLLFGFLAFLIYKFKLFVGAKLVAFVGSVLSAFIPVVGPIILVVIITIAIGGLGIELSEKFHAVRRAILHWLAIFLLSVRTFADKARAKLVRPFRFLVLFVEAPIVCASPIYGIWSLMDQFDRTAKLTGPLISTRLIALLPFAIIIYRNYRRDTTPSNKGEIGLDVPTPIQLSDLSD